MVTVASLEQLGLIVMPGSSYSEYGAARPASITGSYLHYPLIIVMISIFLYSWKKKVDFVVVVGFLAPFIAFSRSGMVLVVVSCFFIFFHGGGVKKMIFLLVAILFSCFFFMVENPFSQRFMSIFDFSEAANNSRIYLWVQGIYQYANSPVFFGGYFGEVTNLTANFTESDPYVVESGVLQLLLNFGLLGLILVFWMYFSFYPHVGRSEKAFIIAFFIQSFVYQSIEVVPLILGLFLFLSVSRSIKYNSESI
ncbi:O-antigen ligase family protein [Marinomonas communis]|uniref:O-antigen ligase family protein n=1 Tax=Marinomonas communis TaxID=28254 RepID=UPI001D18ACD8|nr:O-antigen ligase family protein [Marinomonas communis]MCC4275241.1 O-antigen ligase family protein [Marinomonas communis]